MSELTPEERAATVGISDRLVCDDIAKAIREAVEAEAAKWANGATAQIPTETMEQEFAFRYRQGYKAGMEAEREACAAIADRCEANYREHAQKAITGMNRALNALGASTCHEIAHAIRERATAA